MTTEYKLKKIQEVLDELNCLKAVGIHEHNHKPHQFELSKKHIEEGKKNNDEITEEILSMFPCGKKNCKLSYNEHKKIQRLVMQLKKDVTQKEIKNNLINLDPLFKKFNISEFAFADSKEKYKFL